MTDWAQERRREKKKMVSNLCMEERKTKKYTWDGPAERSMLMTRTRRCVWRETLFSFKEILFLCVAAAVASSREREGGTHTQSQTDGRTDGREKTGAALSGESWALTLKGHKNVSPGEESRRRRASSSSSNSY